LAGAIIVEEEDEVLVVLESGKVVRSPSTEVPARGRDTMGVVFTRFDDTDRILAIAKNSERNLVSEDGDDEPPASPDADTPTPPEGSSVEETTEADPTEDVND